MEKEKIADLYTDYLLSSFSKTTATGLSHVLEGAISHDQVTRFLASFKSGSKELWRKVKPSVRSHENENACLIFDDSIIEKAYTDENEIVCWHYDHSKQRTVKGINLLSAFYHSDIIETQERDHTTEAFRIPIAYEVVAKTLQCIDEKTKKEKRKSVLTKNERMQGMISQAISNQLKFKYVIADSWFGSSENMRFIKSRNKFFIFDMKINRQVALSQEHRNKGQWTSLGGVDMPDNKPTQVWLKDLEFPVMIIKQVFKNKDNSIGVRFLVSNDFDLSADDFKTIYKKRWSVEEYHKSLKQNVGIGQSPTRTVQTQSAHLFASILAYVKYERLKFCKKLNHFAIKAKIYLAAMKAAFMELQKLYDMNCA